MKKNCFAVFLAIFLLLIGTADASLVVQYIDVGQGDAALLTCDGANMLIDGGDKSASQLMYTYLKERGISHLDYVIASHGHDDHVGGLAGALNFANADVGYTPSIYSENKAFENYKKYLEAGGGSLHQLTAGESFEFGGALVEALGPLYPPESADSNNASLVLKVSYGNTSFLFVGDAEREEEYDLLNAGIDLSCDVLKVGHHGSSSSSSEEFIEACSPQYAIISVGRDNSYHHPNGETLSTLNRNGASIYRTDLHGDIVCESDGHTVTISTEKKADESDILGSPDSDTYFTQKTEPVIETEHIDQTTENSDCDYVLNTNTHKFHYPYCGSVTQMKEKNKQLFSGTREELVDRGYSPCGKCNP